MLRTLEREPQRRYQHASEVKTDIEAISGSPPLVAPVLRCSARPRFSRKAIIGAAWCAFFFIFVLGSVMLVRVESHPTIVEHRPAGLAEAEVTGPDGGQPVQSVSKLPQEAMAGVALKILFLIMLPLGLTAPFGTTILGIVSIGDIRHSAGGLYGLPLALADALLFPLLVLARCSFGSR